MKIKEALQSIDSDALFKLCELYDEDKGLYPEHPYEGAALYRFFIKEYAKVMEDPGFVGYIKKTASSGSLREMFYGYFIAHLGVLPEDDSECEEVIKEVMSLFFGMNKKRRK
jgi:hypothetical protein